MEGIFSCSVRILFLLLLFLHFLNFWFRSPPSAPEPLKPRWAQLVEGSVGLRGTGRPTPRHPCVKERILPQLAYPPSIPRSLFPFIPSSPAPLISLLLSLHLSLPPCVFGGDGAVGELVVGCDWPSLCLGEVTQWGVGGDWPCLCDWQS